VHQFLFNIKMIYKRWYKEIKKKGEGEGEDESEYILHGNHISNI